MSAGAQHIPGVSAPPPSASERWRSIPRCWRVVLVVLGTVVGLDLVSSTVSGLGGSGGGASGPSSAFDASPTGTGAFAQLLAARGYHVRRLTVPLSSASLAPHTSVFVLDPTAWSSADNAALAAVVRDGGRVVVGGRPPAGALRAALGAGVPRWTLAAAGTTLPVSAAPVLSGVSRVDSPGAGTFAEGSMSPPIAPLLAGVPGVLAVTGLDPGAAVALASSSPLQNGAIARQDNAAFGLNLAGPPGSQVVFDEYDHGFGRPGRGLAGLPAGWRWGLGIALLAVVVWLVSAARRFGPPASPDRVLAPARVGYVDAMATLLAARSDRHVAESVAPVRDEARRRLARRVGLPPDAPADELVEAASAAGAPGTPPGLAAAVARPPRTAADVVALGSALALLERQDPYR